MLSRQKQREQKIAGKSTTLMLFHGEAETAPNQLHLAGT